MKKPGRPVGTIRKEPTKVIRVPVSLLGKVKELINHKAIAEGVRK